MKHILLFILASITGLQAQITISEILYESPSWDTDLQYIELLNFSEDTISLSGWSIEGDLYLPNLPDLVLLPGDHLVFTSDIFGLVGHTFIEFTVQWGLSDRIFGNPFLLLIDPSGQEVVRIKFDEELSWPISPNGVSIELCDPTLNVNDGLNWALAGNSILSGNNELVGTPDKGNSCSEIRTSSINFNQSEEIVLYPTPCNSILNIKGLEVFQSIIVYSISGIELLKVSNSNSIDVSSLNNGIYNVSIMNRGNRIIRRFVKL